MRPFLLFLLALVAAPAAAELPVQGYEIAATYPHDPGAFTQGLFFRDGYLFESTGLIGRSTVRKVRLEDGQVLHAVRLPGRLFGEGITDWGDEIVGVTWQDQVGYRLDMATMTAKGRFTYSGEGWGLAQDGKAIILSDGTPILRFLDPVTMRETRRVHITAEGVPVDKLNELEWVKDELLANIWQSNRIARIDPETGEVKSWIDLSGLDRLAGKSGPNDVLNGIAYDAAGDRLFVTGKLWPKLFEIRLTPARSGS